ncbi:hypothetical protein [Microseira wollei]|uniref:Uncharacterized protein n=1 Tax=Microseira wollei NIES-4236 TaxID=2530354 RepID=A0AAV3X814_9CYAN|nr:hypothetical protein [Microseira wollei]GET36776.1 hypothetical protein MiSe_15280 [Microseira wollei NIES-4236]
MKYIALLLLVTLWFVLALPAQASFCRTSNHRVICIKSIKRSAKNYWEYRAVVSIDGVARPIEVYNCRDRLKLRPDGTIVEFESDGAGELICNLLKK